MSYDPHVVKEAEGEDQRHRPHGGARDGAGCRVAQPTAGCRVGRALYDDARHVASALH